MSLLQEPCRYLVPIEQWKRPLRVGLLTSVNDPLKPMELYAKGYSRQLFDAEQQSLTKWYPGSEWPLVVGIAFYDTDERPVHWQTLCGGFKASPNMWLHLSLPADWRAGK